jgi:hypothetical protein
LDGKSVVFVVSGGGRSLVRSAITDYQGKARLGAVPLPAGAYTVDAYFNGTIPIGGGQTLTLSDDYYTSSRQLGASLTIGGTADTTPPTLNPSVSPNPVYLNGSATASPGATDSGSGIASQSCAPVVTSSVGTKTITCTATDNAGNTATATVTYRVIYRFDGFLQPINDTAHPQICGSPCPISIFKGGSTVPVKFQLKDANGNLVQAGGLPLWPAPVKGSPTSGAVDETVYSAAGSSGNSYRWDSTTQQYIYNWNTKGVAAGFFWRIGVTLDDGQTYYVNVGLR